MGDHSVTDYSDPAANAPDAAAYGKGKGKAADAYADVNMGEEEDDESSEEEEEELVWPRSKYVLYAIIWIDTIIHCRDYQLVFCYKV